MRPLHARPAAARGALLLAVAFAVAAAPSARASPGPDTVVLGLSPEVNVFRQKARYQPLAEYLGRKLGRPVDFTILLSYGAVLGALERSEIDGAFLGSFAAALAVERLGAVPLARVAGEDGSAAYRGVVFVRNDSGIRSARDLRGKRMAFVDRATSAGYVFPLAWLREQGLGGDRFFAEEYFAGSHDAAVRAVLDRKVDAGAAKDQVLDRMRAADPRIAAELVVLATSRELPSTALCVRGGLDPALRTLLSRALLGMATDPAAAAALASLDAAGFVETAPGSYEPVLRLAREAGLDVARHAVR